MKTVLASFIFIVCCFAIIKETKADNGFAITKERKADTVGIALMHAYKLALLWPTQYCAKHKCLNDYENIFMIHGLWPMDVNGKSLDARAAPCQPKEKTTYAGRIETKIVKGQKVYGDIYMYWKDLTSGNPYRFWQYQWSKHGQCSEFPSDPAAYFEFATTQAKKYNILEILKNGGIQPNATLTYPLSQFSKALKDVLKVTVEIHCETKPNQIAEVRICMNPDAKLIDCSSPSTGCDRGQNILFRKHP